MNYLLKSVSPQTTQVYNLLLKQKALTARQIGKRLNILPNAVYRSIKPLIRLGCVEGLGNHPVQFRIKPINQALNSYLFASRENFLQTFFPRGITTQKTQDKKLVESLNISFIKDRKELLEYSNKDMNKAKSEVNFIVSGLEVPAEIILGFKQAFDRGVKLRFLVQRLDEVNKQMLKNWKKLGINVKYFPLLEARIIIIDSKITYITSYNPNNQEEGIGVRFNHPPIAKFLNELFEARWRIA